MRAITWTLVAALVVSLELAIAGAAGARSPTPTPTPTPSPTVAPATAATFDINLWVDGRQSWEARVVPRIGDVVCGGEVREPISPIDSGLVQHYVRVESDAAVPGCGTPGATVTFFVGDRQAHRTAEWAPGYGQSLVLIVGPPFARVRGEVDLQLTDGYERLVPFAGDIPCGYQENPWQGEAPPYGYGVVVYSQGIQAGCGTDGANVTFKLLDRTDRVIAVGAENGVWRAWDGTNTTVQHLDLTMTRASGVIVGDTGSGGSRANGDLTQATLALAIAGFTALAAGCALSRHT